MRKWTARFRPWYIPVLLAFQLGYAFWLFRPGGLYWELGKRAGGELPDQVIGYPDGQPLTTLEAIGSEGRADYLVFMLLDLPNFALTAAVPFVIFALFLTALGLGESLWRRILRLPVIFFCFELAENLLLAISIALFPAIPGALALAQQFTTTVKLILGIALFPAAILVLIAYVILAVVRMVKARTSSG